MVESIFNTKKAKNIVLHDTRENLMLQILQIDGNTEQNSTSGKNLLDCSGLTATTTNGVTFTPVYDDKGLLEYINVNGTATAQTNYQLVEQTPMPTQSMFLNGCVGGTGGTYSQVVAYYDENNKWKTEKYQITTDLDIYSATYSYYASSILVRSGTTLNNVKFYPMIRLATITDATYEPFTNGASPNPDYPQEIKSVEVSEIKTTNSDGSLENIITLSEPITLNGIGDVRDCIDVKRGVKVQKFGVAVFDGSDDEAWTKESDNSTYTRFLIDLDKIPYGNANERLGCFLCTHAVFSGVGINGAFVYNANNERGRFFIYFNFSTTLAEWKAHLQSNPVTVVYELAEPIETPLPEADVEALKSLETFDGLTYVVLYSEINPKSISVLYELLQYRIDWTKTDFFNTEDYNRIIGNIAYLRAYLDTLFLGLTNISTMEEKTFESLLYAREINAIETALEQLNLETYKFDIGETKEYLPNTRTLDFVELNRIESAILLLYKTMTAHKNALPKLAFTLGGRKGFKV